MWSKESAIMFMFVSAWMDRWFRRTTRGWSVRAHGLYALVAASWIALRWSVLRTGADEITFVDNPLASVSTLERLLTAARVQLDYLRLQLVPVGFSSDYSYNQIPIIGTAASPFILVFALACVGAAVAGVRLGRKHPIVPFALGGYTLLASTTSNFLFPIVTIMAERLAYAPSLFTFTLVGCAAERASRGRPRIVVGLVIAAILALTITTLDRNRTWATPQRYFEAQLRSAPGSAKAQYNIGNFLQTSGRPAEAISHYRRALEIDPGFWSAWNNLGLILHQQNRFEEALAAYQRAIACRPGHCTTYNNLGILHAMQQQPAAAARAFRRGHPLRPGLRRRIRKPRQAAARRRSG